MARSIGKNNSLILQKMYTIKNNLLIASFLLAFTTVAQQKIEFRDGNTLQIEGIFVCSKMEYTDDSIPAPRREKQFYLLEAGNNLKLSVVTNWMNPKLVNQLDEVRIYQFTKDQLEDVNQVNAFTDENEDTMHFYLTFDSKEEQPFRYQVYSIYNSQPEVKTWTTLSFESTTKAPLDVLYNQFLIVPKTEDNDE